MRLEELEVVFNLIIVNDMVMVKKAEKKEKQNNPQFDFKRRKCRKAKMGSNEIRVLCLFLYGGRWGMSHSF